MKLKEKIVLLTGASGGIGSALAKILIEKEAYAGLMARNKSSLEKLTSALGNKAIAIPGDVGDRTSAEKAVKEMIHHFGKIDVLINNAGIGYYGTVENMDMNAFDRMMKTNVYGVINMIQLTLPYIKQRNGMVVNISSVAGKRAIPLLGAYSGSKAMVDAISDALRVELMDHKVKVLNFCPPEVDTDFSKNALKDDRIDFGKNKGIRNIFVMKPEKVAMMIVNAIEKEKREVVVIKLLQFANCFMPSVLDLVFHKFVMHSHKNQ